MMLESPKKLYFHSGIYAGKGSENIIIWEGGGGGGVNMSVYAPGQVKGGRGGCHRHKCLSIQMWV